MLSSWIHVWNTNNLWRSKQRNSNNRGFCKIALHHWSCQRTVCWVWTWCEILAQDNYVSLCQKLYGKLCFPLCIIYHTKVSMHQYDLCRIDLCGHIKKQTSHSEPCEKAKVGRLTRSPLGSFPSPMNGLLTTAFMWGSIIFSDLGWSVLSLVRGFSHARYHHVHHSKDFYCRLGISFQSPSSNYHGQGQEA